MDYSQIIDQFPLELSSMDPASNDQDQNPVEVNVHEGPVFIAAASQQMRPNMEIHGEQNPGQAQSSPRKGRPKTKKMKIGGDNGPVEVMAAQTRANSRKSRSKRKAMTVKSDEPAAKKPARAQSAARKGRAKGKSKSQARAKSAPRSRSKSASKKGGAAAKKRKNSKARK